MDTRKCIHYLDTVSNSNGNGFDYLDTVGWEAVRPGWEALRPGWELDRPQTWLGDTQGLPGGEGTTDGPASTKKSQIQQIGKL